MKNVFLQHLPSRHIPCAVCTGWLRITLVVCILLAGMPLLYAQFYLSGTEPARTRWSHLVTPQADIIFQNGHETEAQFIAHNLQQIDTAVRRSLLAPLRRIPLVLHSQSMTSNGFQVWTPRRMEFYAAPSPTQYTQSWLASLAVHEYRHAAQIGKLDVSLPDPFKWLFGEQPTGALSACLPLWYLEGDAVVTETALTNTGRGRTPGFSQLFRAQLLSGQRWSYEKAYLGSFKDQIPNHYVLGYHLVSWLRSQTGNDIFGRQLAYLGSHPYRLGLSWRQTTGATIRHWYESMADTLFQKWTAQDNALSVNLYAPYTRPADVYTDYRSPQVASDLSVVAVKSSLMQVPHIVCVAEGGAEKILVRPGELTDNHLSCRDGQIVWSEIVPDVRWSNRSTTRIRSYDMTTGRIRTVRKSATLHTPVLSPDNRYIAAVGNDSLYRAVMEVFHNGNGNIVTRTVHPAASQLQSPAWSTDGGTIYAIVLYQNHKRIESYSLREQSWTPVSAWTTDDIQHLSSGNGWLFFDSPRSGISNIHGIRFEDMQEFSLTSARFGAVQGMCAGTSHIVYADFTPQGYQLVSARLLPAVPAAPAPSDIPAAAAEQFSMADLDSLPAGSWPVKPYRKAAHLLHVHSWAPCFIDYQDFSSGGAGVSAASQDLLGLSVAYGGCKFEDDQYIVSAGIKYMGWYPILDFHLEYGGRIDVHETQYMTVVRQPDGRAWDFSLRTYIPFVFSRNAFNIHLTPLVQLKYSDGYFYNSVKQVFERGAWEAACSLKWSATRRVTSSELSPRLGVELAGQYTHAIQDHENFGYIGYVKVRTYLPGLFDTHRISLEGGWQKQHKGRFIYSSGLDYPRGYSNDMVSLRMRGIKTDYLFPLMNPDLSLGRPIYIKRLYASLFYDEARHTTLYYKHDIWGISLAERTERLRSTGIDVFIDCHLFRFYAPVTLGVRYAWLPEERSSVIRGLAGITF